MAAPRPYDSAYCPYNGVHSIDHYKLHLHLVRCGKQHPRAKIAKCPYDSVHVVDEVEKYHHSSVCCKRDMLDNMLYIMDDDQRPVVPVQPAPTIHCDENWDDEESATYIPDPWKNPYIIKKVKGATKSERRRARMEGVKSYRARQLISE